MTDEQIGALQFYVERIGNEILLADWQLDVVRAIIDEDLTECHAQIDVDDSKKRARIWFAEDTPERKPDEIRYTVVHELCHVHFDPLWRIINTDLRMHLGNQGHWIVSDFFRRQTEIAVDSFARLLAPQMPMFLWTMGFHGD